MHKWMMRTYFFVYHLHYTYKFCLFFLSRDWFILYYLEWVLCLLSFIFFCQLQFMNSTTEKQSLYTFNFIGWKSFVCKNVASILCVVIKMRGTYNKRKYKKSAHSICVCITSRKYKSDSKLNVTWRIWGTYALMESV